MAAALLATMALGSCGESEDREALKSMILASVFETGPETCVKFGTLRYLEWMTRREGEAAIAACEEDEEELGLLEEAPSKVDVSSVDVDADSATALVAFTGSIMDGQKVRYDFVKRDDRWKYDEFGGFVDLDAEHLIFELGQKGMLAAKSHQGAENIACWLGRMERMSDEALEDLLFGGGDVSPNCTAESNAL